MASFMLKQKNCFTWDLISKLTTKFKIENKAFTSYLVTLTQNKINMLIFYRLI